MNLRRRNRIYLLLLLFCSNTLFGNDIKNKSEETIKQYFTGDIKLELITFEIPYKDKEEVELKVKQRFFEDKIHIWKVIKNSEVVGFAVLDNVYGKSMPITFLVLFDKNLSIINSSIIKYREPYGGAVKNPDWNEQFSGKNGSSGYEVGKDINGISGATISVNSVSKGIRKLALLMPIIIDKL